MDKWSAAFTAIGGLAAVGGLIDLALYKSEKEKLKAHLEDWWLRFADVKWSNFGRAEAELAVQILDRWAGPRLWSWQRWWFSLIVTLAVYVLAVLLILVGAAWNDIGVFAEVRRQQWLYVRLSLYLVLGFQLTPAVVAFALSLSVTRYIAITVARVRVNALLNAFSFTMLLLLHVMLLQYWTAVVFKIEQIPLIGANWINYGREVAFAGFDKELLGIFRGKDWAPWTTTWPFFVRRPDLLALINVSQSVFKFAMDIVANGLRILFALVFLSSFVFRPLIQEPVSRLWYGAMNSGKPIFAMLFGAVGTVIAVTQILTK